MITHVIIIRKILILNAQLKLIIFAFIEFLFLSFSFYFIKNIYSICLIGTNYKLYAIFNRRKWYFYLNFIFILSQIHYYKYFFYK